MLNRMEEMGRFIRFAKGGRGHIIFVYGTCGEWMTAAFIRIDFVHKQHVSERLVIDIFKEPVIPRSVVHENYDVGMYIAGLVVDDLIVESGFCQTLLVLFEHKQRVLDDDDFMQVVIQGFLDSVQYGRGFAGLHLSVYENPAFVQEDKVVDIGV